MRAYIFRSILRAIVSMLLVMAIVFVALRAGPIDPAQFMLGDRASAEAVKSLRETMELDRPIYVQYARFLSRIAHGDFGKSFLNSQSVLSQLLDVLPYTFELVAAGVLIGICMGIPPGIIAAVKVNTFFDQIIRFITLVGISVPIFVVGLILISIFSLRLDLLPIIGGKDIGSIRNHVLCLVLPAFSCGFLMMASIARLTRASLLDVLKKEYVMTARSKGLRESIVILKHAMRNALVPLITFLGIYINLLLGAAVLVEVIFTRPGVGRLIVEAIKSSDFPMVQTILMFYAGAVVAINLLVDLAYCLVDPRITLK